LIVFLYRFRDAAGAERYLDATLRNVEDAAPFEVTGIPDAHGLVSTDPEFPGAAVFFTKGTHLGNVVANGPSAAAARDLAATLARDLYSRLP
jgi:hypothetical protein